MAHLDDPVLQHIPLIRTSQTYILRDLPKGKYIVCGEAMDHSGSVYQESCFETRIRREDTDSKYDVIVNIGEWSDLTILLINFERWVMQKN